MYISNEIVEDDFISTISLHQGMYLLMIKTKDGLTIKNVEK